MKIHENSRINVHRTNNETIMMDWYNENNLFLNLILIFEIINNADLYILWSNEISISQQVHV